MLTPDWLQSFHRLGFVARPDVLDSELLAHVRAHLDQVITHEIQRPQPSSGVARVEHGGGRLMTGISEIYPALGPLALLLLGHPAVVESAQAICGADAIPTHDWMVIKNRGDGCYVGWHQDFAHHDPHPAINIGIHLDRAGEDAVRFLPQARGGHQPVERYAALPYDAPELVAAPVAAGGITIHDVTLVHGSPPLTQQLRRATLYVEFRHPEALRDHPSISAEYVALRRRLFEAAQRAHARHPGEVFSDAERAILTALNHCRSGIEAANYGNR